MISVVYVLCSLVGFLCGILLLRAYRTSRMRLLLWSSLCFLGLGLSNMLTFLDLVIFPDVELYEFRLYVSAIAMVLMVFGLIWDSD
jgi:hypothetical protein